MSICVCECAYCGAQINGKSFTIVNINGKIINRECLYPYSCPYAHELECMCEQIKTDAAVGSCRMQQRCQIT